MKTITKSLGALMLGTTLVLSSSVMSLAAEKMRISLQLPLKSHLGQNLVLFEKEVEERTGGAIDVEIYDLSLIHI